MLLDLIEYKGSSLVKFLHSLKASQASKGVTMEREVRVSIDAELFFGVQGA